MARHRSTPVLTTRCGGEASLPPHPDAKWKARYTDPSGRDRSRTFARKLDAEKFLERVGAEMQKGEWIDPRANKTRFADWVDVWWKTTVKLAPSTRWGYDKLHFDDGRDMVIHAMPMRHRYESLLPRDEPPT